MAASECAGSTTPEQMCEAEIGDTIPKDIVESTAEWHEAEALCKAYGIEKQRMNAILESWAKSQIVEWWEGEGGRSSVRLKHT